MLSSALLASALVLTAAPLEPIEEQAAAARNAAPASTAPTGAERSQLLRGRWPGSEKRISVDLDGLPTREALKKLAAAAGWSIVFKEAVGGTVDVSFNDLPADEALAVVLKSQGLVAERDGNLLTISKVGAAMVAPGVPAEAAPQAPAAPAAPEPPPVPSPAVERGRTAIGHSIKITQGETVRDVVSVGGDVEVDGTVMRDAVSIGGRVIVGPNGVVNGDAVTVGGKLELSPGGVVKGDRVEVGLGLQRFKRFHEEVVEPPEESALAKTLKSALRWALIFVIGLLMLAFDPRRLTSVAREIKRAPVPSAVFGVAGFIGLMPLTLLLIVSLVGILALPFLGLGVMAAVLVGMAALALEIGDRMSKGVSSRRSQIGMLALGTLVLFGVAQIPYLGFFLVWIVGTAVVFGAVLKSRFGSANPNDVSFSPPVG